MADQTETGEFYGVAMTPVGSEVEQMSLYGALSLTT